MPLIEGNRPEALRNLETAVHESFFRSLVYCGSEANSIENTAFLQCMKAAGVNFSFAYDQFANYKIRKQQSVNAGYHD
jgi:hypothetical protein